MLPIHPEWTPTSLLKFHMSVWNKQKQQEHISFRGKYVHVCLPYPCMLILWYVCMMSLLCCLNKALSSVSWMGLCRCVLHSPYEASSCSCSRQQLGVAESILTLLSGGSILSHRLIVTHRLPASGGCRLQVLLLYPCFCLNHSPLVVNPILSPSDLPRILQINVRSQGQTSIS